MTRHIGWLSTFVSFVQSIQTGHIEVDHEYYGRKIPDKRRSQNYVFVWKKETICTGQFGNYLGGVDDTEPKYEAYNPSYSNASEHCTFGVFLSVPDWVHQSLVPI